MARPAAVSAGRRGQEKRRCEDDSEEETGHTLHARASRRLALPLARVILGGATGEAKGEARLTLPLCSADEGVRIRA
jgi:hypothetical protein